MTGLGKDVPIVDASKPSAARIFDYWRGGTVNLAVDRAAGRKIEEIYPQVGDLVRSSVRFSAAVTAYAAANGYRRFLDLGSGIPDMPGIHEIARDIEPGARTGYVDHDEVAYEYAQTIARTSSGVSALLADISRPEVILASPALAPVLDGEPVMVLLASVLPFFGPDQARAIVAGYRDGVPSGSLIAISCVRNDDPASWEKIRSAYTAAAGWNHEVGDIFSFFAGLDLAEPGITVAETWRGGWPAVPRHEQDRGSAYVLAGAGRTALGLTPLTA